MRDGLNRMVGGAAVLGLASAALQMYGSRIVGQAAGLVSMILIARVLGTESFGLYSFAMTTALLLSEIPGSGLDLSTVRLSSREWALDQPLARGIVMTSGLVKAGFGLALGLLGTLLADPIAVQLLGRTEWALPLRLAAWAALAIAMTEFMTSGLQARERFGQVFLVSLAVAALKLSTVVFLVITAALTLQSALAAFLIAAYGGAILSALVTWRAWAGRWQVTRGQTQELYVFSRGLVLGTLLGVVTNNLDVLALVNFSGAQATGIYSSGRTLALPLALAGSALGGVLLPKVGRMAAVGPIGPFVQHLAPRVLLATFLLAMISILAAPVAVPLAFGEHYVGAVPVVQTLAVAYCIQIFTWIFLVLLMIANRPDLVASISLVILAATGIGYALVVPSFGAVGAAVVYCGGMILSLGLYLWLSRPIWNAPVAVDHMRVPSPPTPRSGSEGL